MSSAKKSQPRRPTPSHAERLDKLRRELVVHREELRSQDEGLRQSNAALQLSKERYAELYDGAPFACFTLDEVGRIIEANLAAGELLDSPRHLLFGRHFEDAVAPGIREMYREFREVVLDRRARGTHETVLVTRTRRFPARIEATALGTDGECLFAVIDESERHRLESQRRQFEARLAETERVESLGILAGGIAHDFNNALAVALAHTELLQLDGISSESAQESLGEIRAALVRSSELTEQMLTYSGTGRVHSEQLELSQVVRSMKGLLVTAVPKGALVLDLAGDLPLVASDVAELRQMILNLVINAAEALDSDGGTVTLRTRRHDNNVVLEVIDTGRGMDEATCRHAFDPFFTTKAARRGLGLAVVHGSVRAHGGTVTVTTGRGTGTTFRVHLPVATPTPSLTERVAEDWKGSGTLLVVDDEGPVRAAMGRLLRRIGYDVCFASDGRAALEVAREQPLCGVILDLTMPGFDGRATLKELKRAHAKLPVILTSGYSAGSIDDAVVKAADGFVAKPFSFGSVLATLECLDPKARPRAAKKQRSRRS